MKTIKILGTGCDNCQRLYETVQAKAKELNIQAEIEKITDIQQIAALGVMSVPAVVVDGKLVHAGSMPEAEKIALWLTSEQTETCSPKSCCCCCGCGDDE